MWIIVLLILAFVALKILKKEKKKNTGGLSEKEIAKLVEAADKKDPVATKAIYKCFDNGLTDEKYNEIRKNVYLPKAQNGDSNAQYWLGLLLSSNKEELQKWWTKSAESGNTEAMRGLALAYSMPISETFGLGINKEKEEYWRLNAAETDPKGMLDLGLRYSVQAKKTNDNALRTRALNLLEKAGAIGCGKTKVEAYSYAAQIYADAPYNNSGKAIEYYLKALNEKPCQTDDDFNEAYASVAGLLGMLYNSSIGKSKNEIKRAAYCVVIASVLDSYWAKDLEMFTGVYDKSEYNIWVKDAQTYNFRLPC